jgi:hypothetical protein
MRADPRSSKKETNAMGANPKSSKKETNAMGADPRSSKKETIAMCRSQTILSLIAEQRTKTEFIT